MKLITAEEERRELFQTFKREAVHLELRDVYATNDLEREKFAAWKAGCAMTAIGHGWSRGALGFVLGSLRGKRYRRACVVSEPLSEYQQWAYSVSDAQVEEGEDLRWAPRRLLSAVALPGNDFWMFDEETVVLGPFPGTTTSWSDSSTPIRRW